MKKIILLVFISIINLSFGQKQSIYKLYLKNGNVLEITNPVNVLSNLNYETLDGNTQTVEFDKIIKVDISSLGNENNDYIFYGNVDIQSLSYADLSNMSLMENFSNSDLIGLFTDANGNKLKKGDILILGKPSGRNFINIQSNSQNINTPTYSNVMFGSPEGTLLTGLLYVPESFSGKKIFIEKIILSKDRKNTSVYLLATPVDWSNIISKKYITVGDIQASLNNGEIINPKAKLTKEMAKAILKEKKELLDLGLIEKDDYEKIKSELSPIILGNN